MKKVLKRGADCRAIPLKRFSLFTFWGLSLYTAILGQFIRSIDIYGLELDQRQKDIEEHELQLKKEETTTANQENQEIDSPFLDELPDIDQTSPATILPQLLSQEAHVVVENEEETKRDRAILESKLEKLLQENKTLRQLILHLQGNISYYNWTVDRRTKPILPASAKGQQKECDTNTKQLTDFDAFEELQVKKRKQTKMTTSSDEDEPEEKKSKASRLHNGIGTNNRTPILTSWMTSLLAQAKQSP